MPSPASQTTPALSLILCSRNDQYMGNSRWRLQTALEWAAATLTALGRDRDAEIVVTDWGSADPLRDAVALSPAAARLTTFITVPPATATALQRDSPFAEVIALNIAARRARGAYIGRIDQDTLVGPRFVRLFFDLVGGVRALDDPLVMGFSNLRQIPFRLASRCPPFPVIARFVRHLGRRMPPQHRRAPGPFWEHAVGIWLVRADAWDACGGYDERMIYMNAMESNMVKRLQRRHRLVDLGALCDYDFHHLEHYDPWTPRRSSVYRRVNPHLPFSEPDTLNPNGPHWGLADEAFDAGPARPTAEPPIWPQGLHGVAPFTGSMLRVLPVMAADAAGLTARRVTGRAGRAWRLLRTHPIGDWPSLVTSRWKARRTRA